MGANNLDFDAIDDGYKYLGLWYELQWALFRGHVNIGRSIILLLSTSILVFGVNYFGYKYIGVWYEVRLERKLCLVWLTTRITVLLLLADYVKAFSINKHYKHDNNSDITDVEVFQSL